MKNNTSNFLQNEPSHLSLNELKEISTLLTKIDILYKTGLTFSIGDGDVMDIYNLLFIDEERICNDIT